MVVLCVPVKTPMLRQATPDEGPLRGCDVLTEEEFLRVRAARLSSIIETYERELAHTQARPSRPLVKLGGANAAVQRSPRGRQACR
jgi:hypothetical protein